MKIDPWLRAQWKACTEGRPRLSILWGERSATLLLSQKSRLLKCGTFRLNALTDIKSFLGKARPSETVLVIPRSEVLQKEMNFVRGEAVTESLEARLSQVLPYSAKEMAYSLTLAPAEEGLETKGLLYAIPDKKIREMLEVLAQADIKVTEAVSEDQTFYWLLKDKAGEGPVILLDRNPERILAMALKEDSILVSRTYPADEPAEHIMTEVSFHLLQSGLKPVKAVISGGIPKERLFGSGEVPVDSIEPECVDGVRVPAALSGAGACGSHPAISLLPSEEKMRKRRREEARLLRSALATWGLWILSCTLFAAAHLAFLEARQDALHREVLQLTPQVSEVRQMASKIAVTRDAERSKERILALLGTLADQASTVISLKELMVDEKNIILQGESPSHALVTETVQILEDVDEIGESRLEHVRLRKRLNQDMFEFEVTAKWQSAT